MNKMKRWILGLLLLVPGAGVPFVSQAQDLSFSQFFNAPLLVNPANTGFLPDADYRLGANYRNQWSDIMQVPYQTMSVYGDAQALRNRITNGWLGLGGVLIRDMAGSGSLTSTAAYGSIAYHQMLGLSSLITAGFNTGWEQQRIDVTKLRFPDQFDGKFFDENVPTDVVLDNTQTSFFDMQVGMNYAYFPNENTYFAVGASVQHINKAQETFFKYNNNGYGYIPQRYILDVDARFKTKDDMWIVNPNAYYTEDQGAHELMLGVNAEYNMYENNKLIGGMYYRTGDAVIFMIGFQIKNLKLMFSYDVTVSALSSYNQSRGAYEFSSIYTGFYNEYNGNERESLCPRF